jgi:hypothetical protein
MESGAELSPTQMLHDWMAQRPYKTTDPALEEGRNERKAVDMADKEVQRWQEFVNALNGNLSRARTTSQRQPILQQIKDAEKGLVEARKALEEAKAGMGMKASIRPMTTQEREGFQESNSANTPPPAPAPAPAPAAPAPSGDQAPSKEQLDAAVAAARAEYGDKWTSVPREEKGKAIMRHLKK